MGKVSGVFAFENRNCQYKMLKAAVSSISVYYET